MRITMWVLFAATAIASATAADEARTNAPVAAVAVPAGAAPATPPKRPAFSPDQQAQHARLTWAELELNAQIRLLTELANEHLKRAGEGANTAAPEKAQWETDLSQELRNKSSLVLKQLNELTKERLALEAAHAPTAPPGAGVLGAGKALNADEFAYVTRLDELMLKVRQELVATDEAARSLYLELQTNNAAEVVGQISDLLQQNARQARQWEKEHSELELKKLEFRALRK